MSLNIILPALTTKIQDYETDSDVEYLPNRCLQMRLRLMACMIYYSVAAVYRHKLQGLIGVDENLQAD